MREKLKPHRAFLQGGVSTLFYFKGDLTEIITTSIIKEKIIKDSIWNI